MNAVLDQRMKDLLDAGEKLYKSPEWAKRKWYEIDSLAIARMYFGNVEGSRALFLQRAEQLNTNLGPKNYESETNCDNSDEARIYLAIVFDLADESDKAAREFEWVVTLCKDFFRYANEDFIAASFLWYGYARLALGRTEEAYDAVLHSAAYFKAYPRNGGELYYRHTQYFLSHMLLPLCEYLLNKNEESRSLAIYGRDEFLRIMDSYSDEFHSYFIYCSHLAYRFPDAYDTHLLTKDYDPFILRKKAREQRLMRKKVDVRDTWGSEKSDPEGDIVQIIDDERGTIDFIGTFDEVIAYKEKLDRLGDFPATLPLFDFYTLEIPVAPEPIVVECDRLLSSHDIAGRFFDMTETLRTSSQQAADEGRKILLWHSNN